MKPKRIRAWHHAERMQSAGKWGTVVLADGSVWTFTGAHQGSKWAARKGPGKFLA